jgi:rod shape determining protein RodA
MKAKFKIDVLLLIPVAVLVSLSLVTLLSLNPAFFQSQFLSLIIAIIAFLFFSQVNTDVLKQFKLPIYIISIIILCITLAIGIESRGATRWIDIFGVRLQFSEILKPFLAIAFAAWVSEQKAPNMKTFFLTMALLAPVFLLVEFQPDLGSAILYASTALFALIITGYPFRWFAYLVAPFIVLSPFIWMRMHDYQRERILTFLNPQADPLGISYNTIQAMIAVGSGHFMGKGLSEGTQSSLRFLPERQTDFIFATIAEGLGFFGAIIIIAAIMVLCYRIYLIYARTSNAYVRVFAACTFGIVLIPSFVNIGMNIGIVPIVGVTLPFVSFGGSSLLSNFIFLGLLSSMSTSMRHKEVLEIR